ncbi:hypothetical protein K503DRAFT_302040 [Rhizopogon vinicolor AM-OR11-026]|uniref:Uncharacterized protein n=1 Tax=Rhizopogon vinicolor AM-OR11-026 TaxID=1314800 RepID=A0A1B7MV01_9AGAM|nr:hypothetical protein K503DRAFT_302040 [Rhizopogon vinicolor AM-OR11-026]
MLSSRRHQLQTQRGCDLAQTRTDGKYFLTNALSSLTIYRVLCAHRWLNGVAKEGTAPDFKIYWTALPKATKQASSLILTITQYSHSRSFV